MERKPYVRDPNAAGGSKFVSAEDQEDFAQEQEIQQWLEREGLAGQFELKHITRKGTARNTLVRAEVRLDQEIADDGSGTFADLIAGSDGRDLYGGGDDIELTPEPIDKVRGYLQFLGFNKGDIEWVIKTLKLSVRENKWLLEKYPIDSEW